MEDMSLNKTNTGSVNECGLINDLNKRGFTIFNSLCEIIANSLENKVRAKKIKIYITKKYIYISDDGVGMNKEAIDNMWSLFRENNNKHKSLGVSGLGAKAATKILSKDKEINYYTYNNSIWRKIKVPWEEIVKNGVYSNMIECEELDNNSKEIKELKTINIKGTILRLPYNEDVDIEIRKHFTDEKKNILQYNQRLDFIFGKFSQKIKLYHYDKKYNGKILNPYDYFTKQNIDYYDGISVQEILVLKDKDKNKFIWNCNPEEYKGKEFKILNKKTQTTATDVIYNPNNIIGNIYIKIGMLENENITLENNEYFGFNASNINNYDRNYFEFNNNIDNIRIELSKIPLIRNKQLICSYGLENFKGSTCRGSLEATLKCVGLRSEIEYETISSQNNVLDKVFGIQGNKIQINQGEPPISLMRLINHIKKERWNQINAYIKRNLTDKSAGQIINGLYYRYLAIKEVKHIFNSVSKLQSLFHRKLAIKEVEDRKKNNSASKIQSLFHRKKAVEELKKLEAVLKIQRVIHNKKILKDNVKTNAVITLQRVFRGKKALEYTRKIKAGNILKGFLYGRQVRNEIVNESKKKIQALLYRRQAQKYVEEIKTLNYKTGISKLSDFLYNKNIKNIKLNLIKNIIRNVINSKDKKKLLESFEYIFKYCEEKYPEHYISLNKIFSSIEGDF